MSRRRLALTTLVVGFAVSCAPTPEPRSLRELEDVRRSAQAREARALAPQAYAHAEELRARGRRALEDGDTAAAQILGEQAIAAHGHAFALARVLRAERRVAQAKVAQQEKAKTLRDLEAQLATLTADADALELRAEVLRASSLPAPSGATAPEREAARLAAARALVTEARLLCVAARLVGGKTAELDAADAATARVEAELARTPATAPIDAARAARTACLARLTAARRPATTSAPAAGAADALLSELSALADAAPSRDERGVVVVLRPFDAKGALSPAGRVLVESLGRVARTRAGLPLLVVVHGRGDAADAERGAGVAQALRAAGAGNVEVALAGDRLPIVAPGRRDSATRNARVEVVFVVPSA
ncbi:MAG: hypothetical protein IT376_05480 [Polyangiaceae bacterium]|nr:hypothetical protein [Polyangiaceae bacterium]